MTDNIPEDLAPGDLSKNEMPDPSGRFERTKKPATPQLNRILRGMRKDISNPTQPDEELTGLNMPMPVDSKFLGREAGTPIPEKIGTDSDAPEDFRNQTNSLRKPKETNKIIPQEEF